MTAYVIAEIEITDPAGYEDYKKMAPASVAAFDGKFVVRGGACAVLEGSPQPQRVVVLEFPDMARARQWWESAEYRAAKAQRQRTAKTRMIVVEGIA
jgi:uncharacterized protein (DUF1330 family)